ncbi:MAG: hypothetical protein JNL81_04630 [Hyphomonadaceae bacterium]|nr:hypothetical protein [Hyphomonadaceae bacterium]
MLDDNPVLKERLMACGAFAGIALFAIAAVDVMVTGGFDLGAARADYNREQPSAYVRVVDAANYVGDRFRTISWDAPTFIDSADAATSDDLAGADDGAPPPDATSTEDLEQQIVALYENDTPSYESSAADYATPSGSEDESPYTEESDAEADKIASAYENASPW